MENSNFKNEIEKKLTEEIEKKLKDGSLVLDDMVDVSADEFDLVENLEIADAELDNSTSNSTGTTENGVRSDSLPSNSTDSENEILTTDDSAVDSDNKTNNSDSGSQETVDSSNNSSDNETTNDSTTSSVNNPVDEVKNMFSDSKNSKSGKNENLQKIADAAKPLTDEVKKNLKPMVDNAKKEINRIKDQGKDAAAKAGGAAISAASGGVVPPKLGEWASKRALNKAEKKAKKKMADVGDKVKDKLSDTTDKVKDKLSDNKTVQNLKKQGAKALDKTAKAIKAIKFFKFIKKYGIAIATAIGIAIVIVVVGAIIALASEYIPGVFGNVKNDVETQSYSKRDQKILNDIKTIVEKYPNVKADEAAYVLATVSYPYHELLQSDNVKSLSGNEEEEGKDSLELLFEDDSNLTASEKYEKYKLIYGSMLDAATEYVESEFKKWLADEFGYELSDDDETDDGNPNNDMYLTIYKKKTYLDKFDELMKEYSTDNTEEKEVYHKYLIDTYYVKDNGYKKLLKNATEETKEEFINAIQNDVLSNADLYAVYIPADTCITGGSSLIPLNAAGNAGSIQGAIYVTLRDYYSTRSDGSFEGKDASKGKFISDDYYKAPALYGTDSETLTFARYIMGVVYAESASCLNSEACAKALMITAKSFAVGRQTSQGYTPEVLEDRTIIHMRGNVGDQDFCDVYEGCKSGRFSKDTWSVWTGEGYNNRKDPLSSEKLANLEKWWNDIADEYVINKETEKFSGNQYNDYNSSCKQGKCVSQTKLLHAAETETDYLNLLFNPDNGGFDGTKYASYIASTGTSYAVTTGEKTCTSDEITDSRQFVVNFAISMVGKIPYYYYEGKSDGYGALGHAIGKNFDDNHFGEETSIADFGGRNKYGLDCSGFVNFVFWHVFDTNLGNGNTDTLKSISTKIDYNDLKPGDLGFLSDGPAGTTQHVGIYVGNDEWVELNPSGVTKGAYPDFKVYYRPNILIEADEKENVSQGDGTSTGEMLSPISGKLLSCTDYPNYSRGSYHGGTDIAVPVGTEVRAVDGGEVETSKDLVGCDGRACGGGYYSYGRYIVIKHDNGILTKYAHLSERKVNKGDKVSKGQVIGLSGETGNAYGAHLHFEVIKDGVKQNPCNYVK